MTSSARLGPEERAVLEAHHAFQKGENAFQRRARLLQCLWREERGWPAGAEGERVIGSRLQMPHAREALTNFLTDSIRQVVRTEVLETSSRLIRPDRLFANLLSSQPLCFNLFGELATDLELAKRFLLRRLVGVERVDGVDFEWSPGRGDERFTGDKSAFDVFIRYTDDRGIAGFVGIEVKYHEALRDSAAKLRPRYGEVADAMGCFASARRAQLEKAPLQQIWRDHLLAGSVLQSDLGFGRGCFAFLYPKGNLACGAAADDYRACLVDDATFAVWTMEGVVEDLREAGATSWLDAFHDRYLAFERADTVLRGDSGNAGGER